MRSDRASLVLISISVIHTDSAWHFGQSGGVRPKGFEDQILPKQNTAYCWFVPLYHISCFSCTHFPESDSEKLRLLTPPASKTVVSTSSLSLCCYILECRGLGTVLLLETAISICTQMMLGCLAALGHIERCGIPAALPAHHLPWHNQEPPLGRRIVPDIRSPPTVLACSWELN